MVTSSVRGTAPNIEFVLLPNRSLNWKAARAAFIVFVAFTAVIAGYFVSKGAWLVLPFAGLELLVLGAGFYLCARYTHSREIIRIESDAIVVQTGHRRPTTEVRIPRAWARIVLSRDRTGWYPSRLLIRSHGRSTEVGSRLVEAERLRLADQLSRVVHGTHAWTNDPTTHRPQPTLTEGHLPTESATG